MIRIDRGSAPDGFASRPLEAERRRAREFFHKPHKDRAQTRFRFSPTSTFPRILDGLRAQFRGKCAYCETPVPPLDKSTTDHHRPKTGALNLDGSFSIEHYWWLFGVWENLYLACVDCNRAKGNRFPVTGRRAPLEATGDALRREKALLLDPCVDDPEEHLVFSDDGLVASETERGRVTIDVLNLNRPSLVVQRRETVLMLEAEWEAVANGARPPGEVMRIHTDSALPFLGLRAQLLRRWLADLEQQHMASVSSPVAPETIPAAVSSHAPRSKGDVEHVKHSFQAQQLAQEGYALENESERQHYFIKSRTIERIEIRNFRIIDDVDIRIPTPRETRAPWLMLLGENGTGKSSLLQAVALTLMEERQRKRVGLDASSVLRHDEPDGEVRVHLSGRDEPIRLQFGRRPRRLNAAPKETKVLLLAYGATRLLPRNEKRPARPTRFSRVDNLFDPFVPLYDAEAYLLALPKARFEMAARALKDLLVLGEGDRLVRTTGKRPRVEVRSETGYANLGELSDGYQSVVGLAVDIMSVLSERWAAMEVAEGIVLVDELGAHLHPRWKMEIVGRLRRVFPRVQFLVTTHDPLCLRGLYAEEVVVMRRDLGGIQALADLPSPEGMRVDQLLTSEHFGLNTTIDPALDELFHRYYELLAKDARSAGEAAELSGIKSRIDALKLLGQTPRERLMLEAADEYLAKRTRENDAGTRRTLRADTRQRMVAMWDSLAPDGTAAPTGGGA